MPSRPSCQPRRGGLGAEKSQPSLNNWLLKRLRNSSGGPVHPLQQPEADAETDQVEQKSTWVCSATESIFAIEVIASPSSCRGARGHSQLAPKNPGQLHRGLQNKRLPARAW